MKNFFSIRFALLALVATLAFPMAAQYVENFTNTTGGYNLTGLPEGWGYIGTLSNIERDTDIYKSSRVGLRANNNNSTYLVSPYVGAGQVGFWFRQYTKSYAGLCEVYYCTKTGENDFELGDKIGEATLPKNATTWTSFNWDIDHDTRVAILLKSGCLDDFVATGDLADETTTAIETLAAPAAQGKTYGLQGKQLRQDARGTLMVKDGKKVVVF